jgi:hypothetical protein
MNPWKGVCGEKGFFFPGPPTISKKFTYIPFNQKKEFDSTQAINRMTSHSKMAVYGYFSLLLVIGGGQRERRHGNEKQRRIEVRIKDWDF